MGDKKDKAFKKNLSVGDIVKRMFIIGRNKRGFKSNDAYLLFLMKGAGDNDIKLV